MGIFKSRDIMKPAFLAGEKWSLTNLKDITVLFGKNGSGKSLLLRALREDMKDKSHIISPERAGTIAYEPMVAEEQRHPDRAYRRRVSNMCDRFRQESLARIYILAAKIGDVASRTGSVPVKLTDIEESLQVLLPHINIHLQPGEEKPVIITRIPSGEEVADVNTLSSGESESISLAFDILSVCALWKLRGQSEGVLLIDEPDLHLHPDLQQNLAEFIVDITKTYDLQVFISTHSVTLLSALGFNGGEKVGVIYVDNRFDELQAKPFTEQLQELTTCLGGHALMGPLFSVPLILLEGIVDYQIWSHVPRFQKVRLAAIPCGGAERLHDYQKALESLFASICDKKEKPLGYALLDGDKTIPTPNPDKPQDYVKYIKLNCYEIENLYLSDEVLEHMGTNWNEARENIKKMAGEKGAKKEKLANCDSWDRKNEDLKDVMFELQDIVDPKRAGWTIRVAQYLGHNKPTGQALDFLGDDVVEAIWSDD